MGGWGFLLSQRSCCSDCVLILFMTVQELYNMIIKMPVHTNSCQRYSLCWQCKHWTRRHLSNFLHMIAWYIFCVQCKPFVANLNHVSYHLVRKLLVANFLKLKIYQMRTTFIRHQCWNNSNKSVSVHTCILLYTEMKLILANQWNCVRLHSTVHLDIRIAQTSVTCSTLWFK